MKKNLVSINDLPPAGKEFSLDDQQIWLEPLKEFKMECRIEKPLTIKIFVMPAEDGCLVRGELHGGVILPCNRCAEDARVEISSRFDEFEEVPATPPKNNSGLGGHVIFERNAPMLNLDEIAWEQFMLALPPNPRCRDDCRGLCGSCGANLNLGDCGCSPEQADPRMAVLTGLKINRPQ